MLRCNTRVKSRQPARRAGTLRVDVLVAPARADRMRCGSAIAELTVVAHADGVLLAGAVVASTGTFDPRHNAFVLSDESAGGAIWDATQ